MDSFEHSIVKDDDIILCPNKPRPYDNQVTQIAASICEFGFTNPVLIDEYCKLIAGCGRLLAARKLKLNEMPAVKVIGLNERKQRAVVIADNKLLLNAAGILMRSRLSWKIKPGI